MSHLPSVSQLPATWHGKINLQSRWWWCCHPTSWLTMDQSAGGQLEVLWWEDWTHVENFDQSWKSFWNISTTVTWTCLLDGHLQVGQGIHSFLILFSSSDGSIGMLRTNERFRNQGLATKLVRRCVQEAADLGLVPFVHIEDDNILSKNFFTKMGFIMGDEATWVNC